ncbi:NlpC/P60 family protein [Clostridium massiliamazoniense]|uniref:C40 family peptidase n=1 Tax=Clostridium massiliamazoniense TaxID=1347366 RepID=UPI0006D7DFD7|nr:C40 family peptidase [Clostridium massiliamazoniense]
MKRRLISGVIVASMLLGTSYPAFATPSEENSKVEDVRGQYKSVINKIDDLNSKIDDINQKMEPVFFSIENNKEKIATIESQIADSNKKIEQSKNEIKEKQKILDNRLRETYKSGTKTSFLAMLLTSRSMSEFLGNIEAIGRVVSLDKAVIEDLGNKKEKLDNQIKDLNNQKDSVAKLNEENEVKLKEFTEMKSREEILLNELKTEKDSIGDKLTDLERSLVASKISTIKSSNSTVEQIRNAINELSVLKSQIISSKVEEEINNAISEGRDAINKKEEVQSGSGQGSGSQLVQPSGNASGLISYAYQFVGKRYVLGATGPDAFDCSGFTQFVFRKFEYNLTRTTYTQVNQGTYVPRDQLRPGDLVFTEGPPSSPGHVGIYVGSGQMVHAANPRKGVIVGPIYNYSTARRIM